MTETDAIKAHTLKIKGEFTSRRKRSRTREGLSWNYDKTIVYCGFDPTFISKTQPKTGIVMAPLVIKALSHFVGGADPGELVLCPVRALLEYYVRARQEGHVGTRKCLFMSAHSGKMTDISAATITRWIKSIIIQAHKVI